MGALRRVWSHSDPCSPLVAHHATRQLPATSVTSNLVEILPRFTRNNRPTNRYMSSISHPNIESSTTADSKTGTSQTKKDDPNSSGNLFLDNIGTMFLILIGSVIAWLVRSYYNGLRRTAVRDTLIESMANADPIELDDLRIANNEFTKEVFDQVHQSVMDQIRTRTSSPHDGSSTIKLTYPEFIFMVRTAMSRMKGEAFTIQCGYIMDRVVLAALLKYVEIYHPQHKNSNDNSKTDNLVAGTNDIDKHVSSNRSITNPSIIDKVGMPVEFWFTVLSMAMYGTPIERTEALHNVFSSVSEDNDSASELTGTVKKMTFDQIVQLIGYLQVTCQIVPDAQIMMTTSEYPLQEYIVGTPKQMINQEQWDNKVDGSQIFNTNLQSNKNITIEMLEQILTSRSVCAWGECYRYKSK